MKTSFRSIWISVFAYSILFSLPLNVVAQADSIKSGCGDDAKVTDFQFSIFPYISINKPVDNEVVNTSFNLLGGYIKEVRKFEVGGIANIERCNAGMCQIAGVGNIVGGESKGFQAAGVINAAEKQNGCQVAGTVNLVRYNAEKCQLAGVANITGGSAKGLQAAGVINASNSIDGAQLGGVLNFTKFNANKCQIAGTANFAGGSVTGLQAAGIVNVSRDIKGAQIAGVVNATKKVDGTQIAGVVNATKEINGAQIAGVGNISPKTKGTQISSTLNIADTIEGAQISGCLNIARYVKGTQIGVFNIADSIDGIPVGVFSIARNGYKRIEFSYDELSFVNASFKTGVNYFYNIFSIGIRPDDFSNPLWTFTYGLGTRFNPEKKISYDLELSSQHIAKGEVNDYLSELYKVYFGTDVKLMPGISMAAGLTYNLFLADAYSNQYKSVFSDLPPYHITKTTTHNNHVLKTWVGFKVAVRFL